MACKNRITIFFRPDFLYRNHLYNMITDCSVFFPANRDYSKTVFCCQLMSEYRAVLIKKKALPSSQKRKGDLHCP